MTSRNAPIDAGQVVRPDCEGAPERAEIAESLSSIRGSLFLPPSLERLFEVEAGPGRRAQQLFIFATVLVGNVLCLGLDYRLGADVFAAGLALRLGPVTILHAAAVAGILLNWPRTLRSWLMVGAQVSLVATVAYLGVLAGPPIQDRYFMVAGILAVLANLMLPRPAVLAAAASLLSMLCLALVIMPVEGPGLDELAVFLCVLIITSLFSAIRAELSARRAFLFKLLDQRGAEDLRRANAQLHTLTRTDALTGLLNRRGLEEALETHCREAQKTRSWLGALMIDIDRFKLLNDALGHDAGDACLVAVAGAISEHQRDHSNLIAARYGGEEFAIILPGAGPGDARRHAEELRRRVEELALSNPGAEQRIITVSVGAAAVRSDGETQSPLKSADQALFEAKEAGRNRIAFAAPKAA